MAILQCTYNPSGAGWLYVPCSPHLLRSPLRCALGSRQHAVCSQGAAPPKTELPTPVECPLGITLLLLGCRTCRGVKRGELEIVRLDDYLQGRFPALTGRVGAMKIDVEGFEGLVSSMCMPCLPEFRLP